MSRPDVTFVLPRLSGGGIERVFLNLAAGLAASGATVEVVLLRAGSGPALVEVPQGVTCVDLAAPVLNDATFLLALPALASYLRRRRPAALYSGITTINLLALAARVVARSSSTVIISEHVPLSVNAGTHPVKRVLPWLAARAYPHADVIVAVSRALGDDLAITTGLPRDRIVTVYNPVVTDKLLRDSAEQAPHPWFTGGAPVILGIGRLEQQKDFATLIRAFAIVKAQRTAKLVILGEGQQRRQLEAEAARLGLSDHIDMPGHTSTPAAFLGHAAVFALSSEYEGFPTVLIEALACGCPVVSTDCPTGPDEILENGVHGALVPVGDERAMAAALIEALDDPRERTALRERGRVFTVAAAVRGVRGLLSEAPARRAST